MGMNLPSTAAVAWYGAVMSTLSFALALYVALRDRARLGITLQANMLTNEEQTEYSHDKPYVMVTVRNKGRRLVTISSVAFTTRGREGKNILLTNSVRPREIAEGKSESYLALQEALPPLLKLKKVIVQDQAGRCWKRRVPRTVRMADNLNRTN
jgi:hypothetical protein